MVLTFGLVVYLLGLTSILFVVHKVRRVLTGIHNPSQPLCCNTAAANQLVEWKFARENGCGKPVVAPSLILGLDRLWSLFTAMKEHRSLELIRSWYQQYGNTFKTNLGRPMIMTIEPKNVQTVLALKFKDFDLGHYRNNALRPLLGEGIFASDGAAWEHSRALVRPNFVRNQITDIEVYERHVSKLIEQIPVDGSTVDLQDLFFRMVGIICLVPFSGSSKMANISVRRWTLPQNSFLESRLTHSAISQNNQPLPSHATSICLRRDWLCAPDWDH